MAYNEIQLLHTILLARCTPALRRIQDTWRAHQAIPPSILLWPNDTIRTEDNTEFSGVVFGALPEDGSKRKSAISSSVARCDAFAVLVVEQVAGAVRAIFESPHGTRTWRYPIESHGDVALLGTPEYHDNTEAIGVLWRVS